MPLNGQLTPQDLGSLAGTLDNAGILTLMDAAQKNQALLLTQKAQEAQAGAQQAQQAYQQAAAAPAPELSAGQRFIPSLLGDVASIIGETPVYRERAQADLAQQQARLMQVRRDNMQALRDLYLQNADEAQKAGDLETTEKYRTKFETLTKAQEVVDKGLERKQHEADQKQEAALRREQMSNALNQSLVNQGISPGGPGLPVRGELLPTMDKLSAQFGMGGGGIADIPVGEVITVDGPDGEPVQLYDPGDATGNARNAGLIAAKRLGIKAIAKDQRKTLDDIQGARDNATDILNQVLPYLPDTPEERFTVGPVNTAKRLLQMQAELGGYLSWRTAAIKALRATAGSGGLRINQKEIELAVANDIPKITDTKAVAIQKMTNIRIMLDNGLRPLVYGDWRREARRTKYGAYPPLPTKGNVKMMNPDGQQFDVDVREFKQHQAQGWVRMLSPPPPHQALRQPGEVPGQSMNVKVSGSVPVYPAGKPSDAGSYLDSLGLGKGP